MSDGHKSIVVTVTVVPTGLCVCIVHFDQDTLCMTASACAPSNYSKCVLIMDVVILIYCIWFDLCHVLETGQFT